MLVEIHMIQNHAPSNLNRDDTGSPKEALFGGAMRARISSQCIKRSIRRSEVFRSEMADHLATRTRRLPEMVRKGLIESGLGEEGVDERVRVAGMKARHSAEVFFEAGLGRARVSGGQQRREHPA